MLPIYRNGLLVVLLALGVAGAEAVPTPTPAALPLMSIVVRYTDADLATDPGIAALYDRIRAAARRVCTVTSSSHAADRNAFLAACYEESLASAVRQVDQRRLASLHAQVARHPPE